MSSLLLFSLFLLVFEYLSKRTLVCAGPSSPLITFSDQRRHRWEQIKYLLLLIWFTCFSNMRWLIHSQMQRSNHNTVNSLWHCPEKSLGLSFPIYIHSYKLKCLTKHAEPAPGLNLCKPMSNTAYCYFLWLGLYYFSSRHVLWLTLLVILFPNIKWFC